MASTISVLGEPERVNLVRALNPDYLLLDIFLRLRWETWTQWTIEAARVKVHHRPYSFEDGPVVYRRGVAIGGSGGSDEPPPHGPEKVRKNRFFFFFERDRTGKRLR